MRALDNISMSIEEGEFVAIVGHSGSGKSTLMNILGCLDNRTSGEYRLCDKNIDDIDENKLCIIRNQYIGFVFQKFHLLSGLTAAENVELPLRYGGIRHSRRKDMAINMLAKMGIGDRAEHYPNEMSGGQQQRVAIARAVVASPSLILADEPTGNLDQKSEQEVMNILQNLNVQGKTVVLITHNMDLAKRTKRTIEICNGKITKDTRNS